MFPACCKGGATIATMKNTNKKILAWVGGLTLAGALGAMAQFTDTTQIIPLAGGGVLGSIVTNGSGSYTVVGGGNDIWDAEDDFTFHYFSIAGDFDVRARIESLEPTARWTKAGLMARETTAADSRMVFSKVSPFGPTGGGGAGANDVSFMYRNWKTDAGSNGGQHEDRLVSETDAPSGGYYVNKWIRLVRSGDVFKGYTSIDGRNWLEASHQEQDTATWLSPVGGSPTPFAATALLGIAVSRHPSGANPTATAEFRDVGSPDLPVEITTQPTNITALLARTASFYVGVSGGSDMVDIQWRKNGLDIPGATEPTYTTPVLSIADDGAVYTAFVSNRVNTTTATSSGATLTVLNEVRVLAASSYGNPSGVTVYFSSAVNAGTGLTPGNYTLDNGATVSGAAFLNGDPTVVLLTTSTLVENTTYQLTVAGVTGAGTPPAALGPDPTMVSFTHGQEFDKLSITQKRYFGIGGTALSDLFNNANYPNSPSEVTLQPAFELQPHDVIDNYGAELSGIFVAPTTGAYTFYMSSDDMGAVYLSTDENPANAAQIAQEPTWNGSREFITPSNGDGARGTPPSNVSAAINLNAGERRYLRADVKEGGGGDNISVYIQLPGEPAPVNGSQPALSSLFTRIALRGSFGIVFTNFGPISIKSAPSDRSVIEGQNTTFAVTLNDGTPPTKATWYSNDVEVVGVNSLSLTVQALNINDGSRYRVKLENQFNSVTTADATLTVISDTTPPTLLAAEPHVNGQVVVHFSEPMGSSATTVGNYTLSGGLSPLTVTAAAFEANHANVRLTLSAPMDPAAAYTLSVQDVADQAFNPNTITPNPAEAVFYNYVACTNGIALFERWDNINGVALAGLTNNPTGTSFPWKPNAIATYTTMDTGADQADNYGARLSAMLVPAVSGVYRFQFITDDQGVCYLSQTGNPADKQTIIEEPGCCAWIASGDIQLNAGQQYYLEVLYKEGGGGDYGRVQWQYPGTATYVNIPSSNLWSCIRVTGASGPADVNALEQQYVTFCADIQGPGLNLLTAQWLENGVVLTGPDSPCYTLPNRVTTADDGKTYKLQLVDPVDAFTPLFESRQATLHVTADNDPPFAAQVLCNDNRDAIIIVYNEEVEPLSAVGNFNYNFDGNALATDGILLPDHKTVIISVPRYLADTDYVLTINDVQDLAGQVTHTNINWHSCKVVPGLMSFKVYDNLSTSDNAISQLTGNTNYPWNPALSTFTRSGNSRDVYPDDSHEGYGASMRAYFVPAVSGNYRFAIYSDDSSQLWLNSTDDDFNAMTMIAEELGCCGPWEKTGTTNATPIPLVAGQRYALMMLYKEGTGGDYGQISAKLETDTTPFGSSTIIPGTQLAVLANPIPGAAIAIAAQPGNASVCPGNTAVFTVGANITGTGMAPVYSWEVSTDAGATWSVIQTGNGAASLSVGPVSAADSGKQYRCVVALPGLSQTSASATLTVGNGPGLQSVAAGSERISVLFSSPVNAQSLNASHYTVAGATVTGAVADGPGRVTLSISPPLAVGSTNQLTIAGVQDAGGTAQCPDPIVANVVIPAPVISKTANFDTGLPPNSSLTGNGAVTGGALHLTDAVNSQQTFFTYDPFGGAAVQGISVDFKLRIGGGTCCDPMRFADGMAMSFANDATAGGTAEEGTGTGLIVAFDSWDNNGDDEGPGTSIKWGGTSDAVNAVATQSFDGVREGGRPPKTPLITDPATGLPMTPWTDPDFRPVHIELLSNGKVSMDYKDVRIFNGVQTGFTPPYSGGKFVFGARTGGANENAWIDDLVITSLLPVPEVTLSGGNATITWVGNTSILQSAPTVLGPWTDIVGATSPYSVTPSAAQAYFRLRQ